MALTKIPTNLITADAIDGTLIANNAINSEHYTDGSIDTAHIAADQITSALIADDQIDSEHIVDGSIDLAHMSVNSIDSDQYIDGSIDNAHLADDAVGIAELSATGSASSSTYLRGDNSWATISTPITALNNATANELVTVGSTTTELDAESGLTYDGSTLAVTGAATVSTTLGVTGAATFSSTISSGHINTQITHTSTDVTAANSNSTLRIGNTGTGNGVYNAIKFAANQQDMYIMAFNDQQQPDRRIGFFVGSVAGDAVADERLSILGDGKVGIGDTSPESPLHVQESYSTAYDGAAALNETLIVSNKHGSDNSGVNNYAKLSFRVAYGDTSYGFIILFIFI